MHTAKHIKVNAYKFGLNHLKVLSLKYKVIKTYKIHFYVCTIYALVMGPNSCKLYVMSLYINMCTKHAVFR